MDTMPVAMTMPKLAGDIAAKAGRQPGTVGAISIIKRAPIIGVFDICFWNDVTNKYSFEF